MKLQVQLYFNLDANEFPGCLCCGIGHQQECNRPCRLETVLQYETIVSTADTTYELTDITPASHLVR